MDGDNIFINNKFNVGKIKVDEDSMAISLKEKNEVFMDKIDKFKFKVDQVNNLGKKETIDNIPISSRQGDVSIEDIRTNLNKVKSNFVLLTIIVWNMQTLNKEMKEDFKKRTFIREWITKSNPHIVFLIDVGTKAAEMSLPNYRMIHDGRNVLLIRFDIKNEEFLDEGIFCLKGTDLNFVYCKPNEGDNLINKVVKKLTDGFCVIGDLNLQTNKKIDKVINGMNYFGEQTRQTIIVKKSLKIHNLINLMAPSDHKMVYMQVKRKIKHTCQLQIKSFSYDDTERIINQIFQEGDYHAPITISQNKTLPSIDEEKYICDKLIQDFISNNSRSIFDRFKYIWRGYRKEPFLGTYIPKKVEDSLKIHYKHKEDKEYINCEFNENIKDLDIAINSKSNAVNNDNLILKNIDDSLKKVWTQIRSDNGEEMAIKNFINFCNKTKDKLSYTTFFLRKNKCLESFNDIRIISIVPVHLKIWENLIYGYVCDSLTKLIDERSVYQFGGRRFGSTYQALFCMQQKYYKNKSKGILFLDLQKGYDSIKWSILKEDIQKLKDAKLKSILQVWFALVNNADATCNGNRIKKTRGVGMGLSLAPIIFEWYVDCGFREANFDVNDVGMYVDDLALLLSGNPTQLKEFQNLIAVFELRDLLINKKKSCILSNDKELSKQFEAVGIETRKSEKYLGINLEINNSNELVSDNRFFQVNQIFLCLPKRLCFSIKRRIIEGALISRLRYVAMMFSLKNRCEKGQVFKLLWKSYKPNFFKLSYAQLVCFSGNFFRFFIDLFDLETIKNATQDLDSLDDRFEFVMESARSLCKTGIPQIDEAVDNMEFEIDDPLNWTIDLNFNKIFVKKCKNSIMKNIIKNWIKKKEKENAWYIPEEEMIEKIAKSKFFKNVKFIQDVVFMHIDQNRSDIIFFLYIIMPQIKEKINKKKDPYENFVFTNLLIPKTEDKNVWNNFLISCITSIYDLICWVISLDDKSEKSIIYAIMILIDEILSASDINVKTVKDMVAMLNYKMKIRENYIETLSNIYDWNDYSEYYIIVDESPENMDYLISIDGSADGDNSGGGIYVRYLVNNVFVEEKYFFEIDPNLKYLRNVAGELLSAIFAVQLAIKKGWSKLNLVFDYIGIPLYFLKVWSSNDMNIQNYRNSMLKLIAKSGLKIEWLKVYSHTNIRINEVADQLAKIGSKVLEPSLDTVKIEQPSFIVKDDAYSCAVC